MIFCVVNNRSRQLKYLLKNILNLWILSLKSNIMLFGGGNMANILEMLMVICFGISWPMNIYKLIKSRTAKGTSVFFYYFIDIGYIAGIASKIINYVNGVIAPWYVWFFYILNFLMVLSGIIIYYRNKRLDSRPEAK